ncbi:MAG TPA: D-alanyl-D-alanine carboxypeptidase [Lachnospiraceae bacterium]|nr:D-alanyl-D-alanine carboxypeptidase [Lachnospiraceae bacterium]
MKKIVCCILACIQMMTFLVFPYRVQAESPVDPGELYAKSACLLDGDSGRVLWGKEEHVALPMASTTKIMTCILALENGKEDDIVTASNNAAGQPKVRLGVREGQRFLLGDLLFSLMLESHNDAAVMIAEHLGGSVEGFAAMMNNKAVAIGCEDTHFVTPNGLDKEDAGGAHHTTAADLAKIMRYCVRESPETERFIAITQTPSHSFSDLDGSQSYGCTNHNALLSMMDGVVSGKTGFTAKAGYCYICAVESEGRLFIVSLLACGWPNNKGYKWKDTRQILSYARDAYTYRNVLREPVSASLPVDGAVYPWGQSGSVTETAIAEDRDGTEELPLLLREDEAVEVQTDMPDSLAAPVQAGEQVGSVTYTLYGEVCAEFPLVCTKDVEAVTFPWAIEQILQIFLLRKPQSG